MVRISTNLVNVYIFIRYMLGLLSSLFCLFVMLSSHQRRFDGALKRRAKRHQSVTKLD